MQQQAKIHWIRSCLALVCTLWKHIYDITFKTTHALQCTFKKTNNVFGFLLWAKKKTTHQCNAFKMHINAMRCSKQMSMYINISAFNARLSKLMDMVSIQAYTKPFFHWPILEFRYVFTRGPENRCKKSVFAVCQPQLHSQILVLGGVTF